MHCFQTKLSSIALAVFVIGCGPAVPADGGPVEEGTTTDGPPMGTTIPSNPSSPTDPTSPTSPTDPTSLTTGPVSTTTSPTDPSTTGEDTGTSADTMDFLSPTTGVDCDDLPDGTKAHCTLECSLFDQDCAVGEACKPWSNDGSGQWNSTWCGPVARDPGQEGDSCSVESHAASGVDDCDRGAMCWNVNPDTLEGTCVSLCVQVDGLSDPFCQNPSTSCMHANDGALPLCLETCDPLGEDCLEGENCYPTGPDFVCMPQGAPIDIGGVLPTQCPEGETSVDEGTVAGCDDQPCCVSYCDLTQADPCADGEECVPYFKEGTCPGSCGDVGFCLDEAP